jgi:hypothetical protein
VLAYFIILLLDSFANCQNDIIEAWEGKNRYRNTGTIVFKRLYGVEPDAFKKMKMILQKEFDVLHKNGGKPPKLTVEDKLYIALKYLREYRTMESIGAGYGVGKSAVCDAIQWVEDALEKDKTFRLPDKKALNRKASSIEYIVVDVTESPINRPKNRNEWYSGKKERHAIKTQVTKIPRSKLLGIFVLQSMDRMRGSYPLCLLLITLLQITLFCSRGKPLGMNPACESGETTWMNVYYWWIIQMSLLRAENLPPGKKVY